MGWWTLGGDRRAPLAERVLGELAGAELVRAEERHGYGETTVHLLVRVKGAPVWVVALVRSDNMVKVMDETAGPYCEPCTPGFYAAASKACGIPEPGTFASMFRERMAGTRAA
jgi:hypothetical protein